jgi:hypothetical protein
MADWILSVHIQGEQMAKKYRPRKKEQHYITPHAVSASWEHGVRDKAELKHRIPKAPGLPYRRVRK